MRGGRVPPPVGPVPPQEPLRGYRRVFSLKQKAGLEISMKLKLHLKSKGALVLLRSVTHTKQRPKHAQTAGELGGTKGTTRQPPKDHKRDENAINWLACCGI